MSAPTVATKADIDLFEPYYLKDKIEVIAGKEISPITDEYVADYPSVVDRFFKRYYYIKPTLNFAPYLVLFHTNRVCLICLAPEHPALKSGIQSINFDIGNMDRSKNTVSGKGKKGAMPLQQDSTLALLTSVTGEVYKVPSCVRGKLIEVHTELATTPKFLETCEEGAGFFAIVLPKPENCDEIKQSLMNQRQYDDYLRAHPPPRFASQV